MKEVIRVAVSGSRTITNKAFVFSSLDFYLARLLKEYEVVVVSGGAVGIDSLGAEWAREKGLKTEIYKPDWTIGKHAGFLRNKTIVDNSDYLIAITTGSNGTASSSQLAEKKGIPIKIIQYG
jgi:predicted Rossmann-fold nucleotide-binding protein